MPFVLYCLLVIIFLLLISGCYTFVIACVRRKELPWFVEDEIKKTSYGKYYDYIVKADHYLKEHNAQDVFIKSHDGLKLHGLWVPAENPKGTILLAHGYRSTKYVDFALVYELYHDLGMNILVPDQRSHGQSEGRFITFGVKESRDMFSWVSYHNNHFGNAPIILSGLSMGASTMLYLADQNLPENVKGIIADCGFTSPKEIISHVFRNIIHLPPAPTLVVTELFTRLFAGFSLTEKDTRKALQNSKLPVLIVHGLADDFVPCQMSKEGFAACTSEKELLLVECAGHGHSFLRDPVRYKEKVKTFLKKNMEEIQ